MEIKSEEVELPLCWAKLEGDRRFNNWCASIDIGDHTIASPANSVKPYIKQFYKHPEDFVANHGDLMIYHEETGSRAYHSATVTLGYCIGNEVFYCEPSAKIKMFIYKHGLITRGQYSGSGDHCAAIRIAIALKNMEVDLGKAANLENDEAAPNILRRVAVSLINNAYKTAA